MPDLIINSLLFLLPFIFIPLSGFSLEIPKVILAEVIIEVFCLIYFFKIKSFSIKKEFIIPILIIILISIFDLFFLNSSISFLGNNFRLQGIFLLWNLILFAILASQNKTKIPKTKWLTLILFLQLVFSFVLGLTADGRIIGTIGEPNALASFVIFIFPLILFSKEKKSLKYISFFLSFILIFLTGSRSGLIAFAIELFIYFLWLAKIKINIITIVSLTIILSSLFLPFLQKNFLEDRAQIWKISVLSIIDKPILGSGIGNIELALNHKAKTTNNPLQYVYVDKTHNIFLDWFSETGIIGLIAFLSIIYLSIKNFIKTKNITYLTAFLGILTISLFNPLSVVNLISLWWLISRNFKSRIVRKD